MSDQSQLLDVVVDLEGSDQAATWRAAAAAQLGVPVARIRDVRLRKHSIDARQRRIKVQLRLEVGIDAPLADERLPTPDLPPVPDRAPTALIVGSGPGGLFAALRCIDLGIRPIVLERGKDASARRFDLAPLLRRGTVIEDSNYCFGEGGAGTFSDGKLYTRATKRGPVHWVYRTLVAHGAPERILVDAHPHIGSNLLPKVVMAMRASIIAAGGAVEFGAKVTDLQIRNARIHGVTTADGRQWHGDALILATGHSARDVFTMLQRHHLLLEAKAFAAGVRIEHPQELIDHLFYHLPRNSVRHRLLPAASYRLATTIDGRGVHSFCMCPGGFIVPAATANDEIVVNGMSLARRDSPFANSGLVVSVMEQDTAPWQAAHGVLAGVALQQSLEHLAKQAGGGGQIAPAQRVTDFLAARPSATLPATSYYPGIAPARLDLLLPPWMVGHLQAGLRLFESIHRGYVTEQAILVGCETRTSSPVRVPRDPHSLQHPQLAGLFPCGEGAGYAGGIVSAALDGMRCAEALTQFVGNPQGGIANRANSPTVANP
jgi:uncharacterized protein